MRQWRPVDGQQPFDATIKQNLTLRQLPSHVLVSLIHWVFCIDPGTIALKDGSERETFWKGWGSLSVGGSVCTAEPQRVKGCCQLGLPSLPLQSGKKTNKTKQKKSHLKQELNIETLQEKLPLLILLNNLCERTGNRLKCATPTQHEEVKKTRFYM